jgi:4-coumarate--CoA ligase
LDWAQVKHAATALSTILVRRYGLKPGDTVSLFSTNTVWYPVAMWAVIRAGGRVNGASPAYMEDEMTHALKTAKSKILMTLPSALKVATAAADAAGVSKDRIFLLEGKANGFTTIQQLIEQGKQLTPPAPWSIPKGSSNKKVCGYLNFSSGTSESTQFDSLAWS